MVTKYALPLTIIFSRSEEPPAWSVLACEILVASDGRNLEEARYMIQDAVEGWAESMIEDGQADRLSRPASAELIAEFQAGAEVVTEYHTLLITVETEPSPKIVSHEFIRSSVTPLCCHQQAAA